MKIEYLKRVYDRTKHHPIEFESIINYAMNPNNKIAKEHNLYSNTYFYRQWLDNGTEHTSNEISDEKGKSFVCVNFAATFQPYQEILDKDGNKQYVEKTSRKGNKYTAVKAIGTCQANETLGLSGLLILDFDHLGDKMAEIRQKIQNIANTFVVFLSPSNKGLKVLIKHNLNDVKKWRPLFDEIREYYLNVTEVTEEQLDISGSDVSRVCYIPFIRKDEFYRKNDSWIWQYEGKYEHKHDRVQKNNENASEVVVCINPEITNELYSECYYVAKFLDEDVIDITNGYHNWKSLGFALCHLGDKGREIFHMMSRPYIGYNFNECDYVYDNLLNDFDPDQTTIYRYLTPAKKAIANYAIWRKYGFLYSG